MVTRGERPGPGSSGEAVTWAWLPTNPALSPPLPPPLPQKPPGQSSAQFTVAWPPAPHQHSADRYPHMPKGETEAQRGAPSHLVGQPSLRVTLSAVSPSVMVTLRRFMWLPLGPEGLAGLAALPLPWPRP